MLRSLLTIVVGWLLGMIPWLLDRTVFQRPKIKGEIRDTFVRSEIGSSDEAPFDCIVTLKAFVVNLRDAHITIQKWSVAFEHDGHTFTGSTVPVTAIPHPTARQTFTRSPLRGLSDRLPDETPSLDEALRTHPLGKAGREGWLSFLVRGFRVRDSGETELRLHVTDSLGYKHKVTGAFAWSDGLAVPADSSLRPANR